MHWLWIALASAQNIDDVVLSCITDLFFVTLLRHNLWFYFHILNSRSLTPSFIDSTTLKIIQLMYVCVHQSVHRFVLPWEIASFCWPTVVLKCEIDFFRVNKSDIRLKSAFRLYFNIFFPFSIEICLRVHQWDKIQSWRRTRMSLVKSRPISGEKFLFEKK